MGCVSLRPGPLPGRSVFSMFPQERSPPLLGTLDFSDQLTVLSDFAEGRRLMAERLCLKVLFVLRAQSVQLAAEIVFDIPRSIELQRVLGNHLRLGNV